MRSLLIPLLLALPAADQPAKKPDIPKLIKQLGSDVYAEREAASAALEKAGPVALEGLRKAMKAGDIEVRRRAERLVDAIEKSLYHEVRKFEAHAGSVNCVCFSPDGKKLASGSEDRTVRLMDAQKLTEERVLRGHKGDIRGVAFSNDGKQLFSASLDGTVRVWEVSSGKSLKVITTNLGALNLAVLADGRQVMLGSMQSNHAARFDVQTGKAQSWLTGHNGRVMSVRLSKDGKRALTASQDGTLRLWDLGAKKQLRVMKAELPPQVMVSSGAVSCAAMSPDGKRAVSGGGDKKLRIWDLSDGTLIRELTGHTNTIWSVAISPDGKRALSGSMDGTMRLWSVGY